MDTPLFLKHGSLWQKTAPGKGLSPARRPTSLGAQTEAHWTLTSPTGPEQDTEESRGAPPVALVGPAAPPRGSSSARPGLPSLPGSVPARRPANPLLLGSLPGSGLALPRHSFGHFRPRNVPHRGRRPGPTLYGCGDGRKLLWPPLSMLGSRPKTSRKGGPQDVARPRSHFRVGGNCRSQNAVGPRSYLGLGARSPAVVLLTNLSVNVPDGAGVGPDDQALLDFLLEESGDLWTVPDEAVEALLPWDLQLSEGPSDGEVEDLLSSLLSPPASSNVLSFSNPCPVHHDHTYSLPQEHDSTDLGGSEISEVRGEEWVHDPDYSYLPFAGSGSYGKLGAQTTPLRDLIFRKTARLILTDEKRVLEKDGFILPWTLPLTKMEEQLLKGVWRKIWNKKSAQESHRKKKVYVGGLKSRVLKCTARHLELQNRIQVLQEQNLFLLGQLRKLQAMVTEMSNRTSSSSSSTCVLVLLLSFCLLLIPAMYSSDTRGSLPAKHGVLSRQLRALPSEDAHQLELPALRSEVPKDSKNQWLNSSGHVPMPLTTSCLLYYMLQAPNAEPPLKWPFLDLFSGLPHPIPILPLQANLTRKEGWFPTHNPSSVILQSRYSS
ncbi:cyclic AMP-responsive element-binding protein 3 [Nycticebus coucang]|uniref:cyclic AMP-responsive element-binding protein 3 n=1 Tax=Nycticebus coucang TaxID=9470 RepID=UPI00234D02F3|nr:cyclic AMP-responsive element-binding protein 3 [Nycticebus coucang]